jgi:hypothetical protein
MLLTKPIFCCALLLISSCSIMPDRSSYERDPATEPQSCSEIVKTLFLKENYQEDLEKALVSRKLLSFSNKFVTIEHPRLDFINHARASLNKSIKNWNNNKYPAFYIFSDEDVIPAAQKYFKVISEKIPADSTTNQDAVKKYDLVPSWIKSFQNYQTEVDQLLDERISLQYNLTLLKKLKLDDDPRDIKISIKRGGQFIDEIVTLRKSDKDLAYQIKKIKTELQNFDGSYLKNGKIKDRIIRQAALVDMLTIVQREFEYGLKNAPNQTDEMFKELDNLNKLINRSELQPTTYGVYRITNKIFIRELAALSKADVAYKNFVEAPLLKFKEIAAAYIQNRALNNASVDEKMGIFKRIYAKISNITAKQAAIGTGVTVTAGIGFERYFSSTANPSVTEEQGPHAQQIERSKQENTKASKEHSSVVEVKINELLSKITVH